MLPQRIVAIGASSVFGRIDPIGGGFIGRLKSWHEHNEPNYNAVFNLGISADTTVGMLNRLISESKVRKPDLIILSLGTNDASRMGGTDKSHTTTLEKFEQTVEKLIEHAKTLTQNILMVSAYPIDDTKTVPLFHSEKYYLMSDIKKYVKKTQEICEKRGVHYLDIFNELLATDYKRMLCEDGLHANSDGHQFIFEKLKAFLIKNYS